MFCGETLCYGTRTPRTCELRLGSVAELRDPTQNPGSILLAAQRRAAVAQDCYDSLQHLLLLASQQHTHPTLNACIPTGTASQSARKWGTAAAEYTGWRGGRPLAATAQEPEYLPGSQRPVQESEALGPVPSASVFSLHHARETGRCEERISGQGDLHRAVRG